MKQFRHTLFGAWANEYLGKSMLREDMIVRHNKDKYMHGLVHTKANTNDVLVLDNEVWYLLEQGMVLMHTYN